MKWSLHPQTIDCEECERVFNINDDVPPCEKDQDRLLPEDVCQKPANLLVANKTAYHIWVETSEYNRSTNAMGGLEVLSRLKLKEVGVDYDADKYDIGKALEIEKVAYPILLQRQEDSRKVKGQKDNGPKIQNRHKRSSTSHKKTRKRS